jgi:hypothetical protein
MFYLLFGAIFSITLGIKLGLMHPSLLNLHPCVCNYHMDSFVIHQVKVASSFTIKLTLLCVCVINTWIHLLSIIWRCAHDDKWTHKDTWRCFMTYKFIFEKLLLIWFDNIPCWFPLPTLNHFVHKLTLSFPKIWFAF